MFKTRMIKTSKALEIVRDVKVCVVLGLGVVCEWGVGVSNFASALIKEYVFSGIYATLFPLPTGAFEAAIVPVCG